VVDCEEKPRNLRASTSKVTNSAHSTNSQPAQRFIPRASTSISRLARLTTALTSVPWYFTPAIGAMVALNAAPALRAAALDPVRQHHVHQDLAPRATSASEGFTRVIFLSVSRPKILQPAALPTLHSMPSCVSREPSSH
jgi:hypothetical protein